MDRQKIIDENLLTPYIMGTLDDAQRVAVERVLAKDKELWEDYQQLEADFEKLAFENAITPPGEVLTGLKEGIKKEGGSVISMPVDRKNYTQLRSRLLVAASLAALFALGAFWFYTQWQDASDNLKRLQLQTTDLQDRINSLEGNLQLASKRFQTITDPNAIPLILEGNEILPNSRAIAYLNHRSREVVVNPKGLPPLGADKTYQMWADVDGKMINMGLVPTSEEWVELAYIDDAESLNITIEPAGGNDHPTVENLISYVVL